MLYCIRLIQNVPNPIQQGAKNGPSAISPSNSFVFITKFEFRPIRITLNSWDTKNTQFANFNFFYHLRYYGCATFDDAGIFYITNELSWQLPPTI